ncbi:MAG: TolC family protein [Myxococcota bacterium]
MYRSLSLAALLLAAEPPSSAGGLSFTDARERARQTHPAILSSRLAAQAARERVNGTGAWDDPVVGAQLWQIPLDNVENALVPGLTPAQRATTVAMGPSMVNVMLMAQQTFPWPGKRFAQRNEAGALAEQAAASTEVMRADVDRAVAYAYGDLIAAQGSIAVLEQDRTVLETLVALSDSRLASGSGSRVDALAARAELEGLQRELIDVRQAVRTAKARLAALIGADGPDAVPDAAHTFLIRPLPPREELLARALTQRPESRIAAAGVRAALARLSQARMAMIPDVTANVSYMIGVGGPGDYAKHGAVHTILGPPDMVTVGVAVPLPVLAPWKQMPQADAARVEHKRAQAEADAIARTVQAEVDQALAGVDMARSHLELHSTRLIPLDIAGVDAARAAYESGQGSLVDLVVAGRSLRGHHLESQTALLQYARYVADLERATGVPLNAFGEGGTP